MSKVGRWLAFLSVISLLISLTGCNTIAGVGEDISGSARAVQHSL
ncbi:entericidin B membrane lipoprotein [Caballeronia sordidicola]|uniref:Entericidin B membrane lipoprotein n=1 Tax=Caballeronia sordidicola TaxID=196367 RepID=A0A158I1B0_CABSO|nr:entericidin B membrane lipoprotein [Caballeronia sordidicola]